MASQEQIDQWEAWVEERPERVREVAERFKPWHLYRLTESGHAVRVYSIDEPEDESQPVTLKVLVLDRYNEALAFERKVFGIKPEDLKFIRDLS